MILLCELTFTKFTHVPFNAGLLATIREAFPKEDLSFFGAASHIEELRKQVGQPLASSVAWSEILPIPSGTGYCERFFRELKVIRQLFRTLPQVSDSRLLFTSAVPSTVLALKASRCFRSKNIPVQMVLHALYGVVGKRYRRPIKRFQDMTTALTLLGNNGIQYLVLEESIRDTVVKNLPLLSGKIEALEHPLSPNEGASQTVDVSEPIRFGFLGFAIKAKGFPLFVKLANEVTAKYGHRTEFHAIGHLPKDGTAVDRTTALATKPASMHVSRADFIRGITPLHYVILPYEKEPYAHIASGVLLDAIAWEKPVIARKIPIFEAIFEKHGDIGYLFSDDAELENIVEQLVGANDKLRYRRQVLNLRSLRKSRAPETLAAAYREICRANT